MKAMSPGDPVLRWLHDLRFTTETECMSVLQGKSICKDASVAATASAASSIVDVGVSSVRIIKENIEIIRANSLAITAELSQALKKMEKWRHRQIVGTCPRLADHIKQTVVYWKDMLALSDVPAHMQQQQDILFNSCGKLVELCEGIGTGKQLTSETTSQLVSTVEDIVETFAALVDSFMGTLIQCMVVFLDSGTSSNACLSMIVGELIMLGLCGEHMCDIIAREGGVRALLGVCRSSSRQQQQEQQQQQQERQQQQQQHISAVVVVDAVRAQALRALATVCCIPESIHELEEVDGVGCLAQILADVDDSSEMVRSEAAGVVAQISSPGLEHYEPVTGFIENMEDLVQSLTGLCSNAATHEVLLLGAAAIANITFMDPMSSDYLLQYGTVRVLVEACQLHKADSLFAKDQIATILANMAQNPGCFDEIVCNNGIELLIYFLRENPSHCSSEAELAACERVQQKAAIALTRLSKDGENAQLIVELGGIQRLVQLCRDTRERHGSSAVLIAALAALRKVVASSAASADAGSDGGGSSSRGSIGGSGGGAMMGLTLADVQQLIEPKLMDSYLICTKMYESYV